MPLPGDSATLPPEINWATLGGGDHAASLTAAAAAHQGIAVMLGAEAGILQGTAASTSASWLGAGGVGMITSATQQSAVIAAAVAWFEQAAALLLETAQTYTASFGGMVPGPLCEQNRATWAALAASNFMGVNTAAMAALDLEYFGHMWTTNAAMVGMWQTAALAAVAQLAVPGPFNPVISDPATASGGVAQAGAQTMGGALQNSSSMGGADQIGQVISQIGQLPQMASQLPQMLGQLPQMASQLPSMASAMLGGQYSDPTDALSPTTPIGALGGLAPPGGATATAGLPVGAGTTGIPAATTSYTRPVSSFTTPSKPSMPSGWDLTPPTSTTSSSSMPMNGMYGPMTGQQQDKERTEQKTRRIAQPA